jgi:hypothetical protein
MVIAKEQDMPETRVKRGNLEHAAIQPLRFDEIKGWSQQSRTTEGQASKLVRSVPKNRKDWIKRCRLSLHHFLDEMTLVESQIAADHCYANAQALAPEIAAQRYVDEHPAALQEALAVTSVRTLSEQFARE